MKLDEAMRTVPVVAILRGVTPDEIEAHAEALHAGGVRIVEIPLNSPEPFESLRRLTERWGDRLVCGSGTVLSPDMVDHVAEARGRIVVAPNTNPAVIKRSRDLGLDPMPGVQTATEAFSAYDAGARYLKLFPASSVGPGHLTALMAVRPRDATVLAVGGAGPSTMAAWWAAGARGFGLGSEIYKPGQTPEETAEKARAAVAAVRPLVEAQA